jgi:hypothetical protein
MRSKRVPTSSAASAAAYQVSLLVLGLGLVQVLALQECVWVALSRFRVGGGGQGGGGAATTAADVQTVTSCQTCSSVSIRDEKMKQHWGRLDSG